MSSATAYTLPSLPGLVVLPNVLPPILQVEGRQQTIPIGPPKQFAPSLPLPFQLRLIKESLASYPEPPANTNHTLRQERDNTEPMMPSICNRFSPRLHAHSGTATSPACGAPQQQ